MGKFNKTGTTIGTTSVITSSRARGETHEGGVGYGRDLKSELFLLAVSNLVGENTFYEAADKRDNRFADLVRAVAVTDTEWLTQMVHWLRYEANMRTAALVAAAEGTKALLDGDMPGGRQLIAGAMRRADEPGEFLAYWRTNITRAIPKPVKRGVSEAVWQLYNEHAALKYDTDSKGYRFADVIELVRPTGSLADKGSMPIKGTWRADLYEYLIGKRHNRENLQLPPSLKTLLANDYVRFSAKNDPNVLLKAELVKDAGLTWENVLSLVGDKVDKAKLWEALIPNMGYMALLRNLRNFDQAGVPDSVTQDVAKRLADPEQVARSRQFPMRFLSAYRAAPSLRWSYPLEQAIGHSLSNIPQLPGRTLVLVDTSGSMHAGFSKDGTLMRWDAATIFGLALGQRCEQVDLWSYSGDGWGGRRTPDESWLKRFPVEPGESLLRSLEKWKNNGYFFGGGTDTAGAVRGTLKGHDRVVILTDEQTGYGGDVSTSVPSNVPLYTFNLAGYRMGHSSSGTSNRHTFGGLTDAAFKMIPWLEQTDNGRWPWETN